MSQTGSPLRFSHLVTLTILLIPYFVTCSQPIRQGPFQVRLHYEPEYNWQQDNLKFGTSYCWSCSGSGADVGSSTIQATKLLDKGDAKDEAATKTLCKQGDTVWVAPCDKKDRKQLFQFEQIDTLPQVDGYTSPLGFFKVAGTELCLTDDRAENCGFDDSDIDYEEKKCYTLQKCATARKREEDLEFLPGSVPEEAMYRDSTGGGSRYPNLPSVASKQLFVGFDPTAPVFEIHIYSLGGYSATQGVNYRKCVSNHHHPKPRELIYAQRCDVARRTDSSYWKVWGETCTPYASCGMCEGTCDTHTDCEGELECYQREDNEAVPGCYDSAQVLRSAQNYCYYPGGGIRLKFVGDAGGSSSLYECEADCDYDSDCVDDLKCYFRSAFEPVPGCKGQGIRGRDYCYHPLRGEVDGDGNEAPRITRSPTQQPTTAKPTPHPTLRKRQKESERPRDYTMYDDTHTDNFSTENRVHMNPFGDGYEDDDQIVGGGDGTETGGGYIGRDPPQLATFELVRNFNCYIRQCSLCEGSCENDGDCAGDLVCCRRDEFGEDAIEGLGCAGKSQYGANYCYHTRPYAELAIVRDSGANCGPGQCTACQGDCDDDSECAGNLKCFQRQAFERVPGCTGSGIEGRDYCYKAPDTGGMEDAKEAAAEVVDEAIGNVDGDEQDLDPPADEVEAIADEKLAKLTDEHYYCQKVPCGVCEGDCNDSTQCSGDLVCIHREGNEPMDRLGCSGKGVRGWDYCVDQLLVDRRTARYDGTTAKWWALPEDNENL